MWAIPSLRQVYLYGIISPLKGVQQTKLQTLWLCLGSDSNKFCNLDMVRIFGQMTQLTTLSLEIDPPMSAEVMNVFVNMPHLVDVELSKFSVLDKLPECHHFPQRLRSFTLTAYAIKQDPMPVLEKLPCLVVLKLDGYSGRSMSCSAWGFPRLQELNLEEFFYTEEWKIEAGAMPKLSHLILFRFPKMSKLPEGLLQLPSLNHLKLYKVSLIPVGDDNTMNELQQKGCEVTGYSLH
jgi:hypothetical protein